MALVPDANLPTFEVFAAFAIRKRGQSKPKTSKMYLLEDSTIKKKLRVAFDKAVIGDDSGYAAVKKIWDVFRKAAIAAVEKA